MPRIKNLGELDWLPGKEQLFLRPDFPIFRRDSFFIDILGEKECENNMERLARVQSGTANNWDLLIHEKCGSGFELEQPGDITWRIEAGLAITYESNGLPVPDTMIIGDILDMRVARLIAKTKQEWYPAIIKSEGEDWLFFTPPVTGKIRFPTRFATALARKMSKWWREIAEE
jgi:hypothetical protein